MLGSGELEQEGGEEQELYEHHRIVCDPGQTLLRLDKFLFDRLANTSRNRIQVAAGPPSPARR